MPPKQWVALLGFGGAVVLVNQLNHSAAMLMLGTLVIVAVATNFDKVQNFFGIVPQSIPRTTPR